MTKFILNNHLFKFFILLINFLIILNLYSIDDDNYIDTINIRKKIFFNEEHFNKYKDGSFIETNQYGYKIGFIKKRYKNYYEMHFYPILNSKDDFYTYGSFNYIFNEKDELVKVKIYFHQDDKTYISFLKNKPGKFDVFLFGKLFNKDLSYYFSFESLKFASLDSVLSLLDKHNISKKLIIDKNDKDVKLKFIDKIIKTSITKIYVEDGARNEFGEFVYIKNDEKQKTNEGGFNCSGFLKEIADNYIRLCKPDFRYLQISDLKRNRIEERENASFQFDQIQDKDPFFGIDWAKNIIDKINIYCEYDYIKSMELNDDLYSFYDKNRGYNIEDLKEILFRDQEKDSTYFYILVFNKLRSSPPIVPQYYHISIIVPYFNNHAFYLRVFESNDETNFNQLMNIHKNEKVIILKVPLPIMYL